MIEAPVIGKWLRGRSPKVRAMVCAHFLAPALVIAIGLASTQGRGLIFDLAGPVTVSELRSEMNADGEVKARNGVALILEPVSAESTIPIIGGTGGIWSSLDGVTLAANRDRLVLTGNGLSSRTPFAGVSSAVSLIVDGNLGKEVQIPGGTSAIDGWRLTPRRSLSILSSVLLACVFAFGMALPAGSPIPDPHQKARRKKGAEPHEH
jgi:hypothetical protein